MQVEKKVKIYNSNNKHQKNKEYPYLFDLKGLSVIVHYELHFFPNPQISSHIQRELHCNN